MLVIDTSAALAAVLDDPHVPRLKSRIAGDDDLRAPHLIDVEALHVLRGMVMRGSVDERRAGAAREDLADLSLVRYPHEAFTDRIWELRHNLTAYDAAFVALAEALEVPLVTCDAKLAAAPGHAATIELFAP